MRSSFAERRCGSRERDPCERAPAIGHGGVQVVHVDVARSEIGRAGEVFNRCLIEGEPRRANEAAVPPHAEAGVAARQSLRERALALTGTKAEVGGEVGSCQEPQREPRRRCRRCRWWKLELKDVQAAVHRLSKGAEHDRARSAFSKEHGAVADDFPCGPRLRARRDGLSRRAFRRRIDPHATARAATKCPVRQRVGARASTSAATLASSDAVRARSRGRSRTDGRWDRAGRGRVRAPRVAV